MTRSGTTPPRRDRPIPRSRGAVRADVAVVGGGLTGLSAALHLLEKGAQVVVIEANEIGSGASGRNGGFVVPHFARAEPDDVVRNLGEGGERLVRLVGNSADALFELVARLGIECDAAQRGWYQAAHSAAAWRMLEMRAAQWARHGQSVGVHDAASTSRLTGTHGYFGSWSNPSGGTVHPLKLVHGLAAAVLARRGEIRENCSVERLTRTANGWQLATVDGEVSASRGARLHERIELDAAAGACLGSDARDDHPGRDRADSAAGASAPARGRAGVLGHAHQLVHVPLRCAVAADNRGAAKLVPR